MTSKQRSYLMSLASHLEPIFHIGKASLTTEFETAIKEALEARELIKIGVLKNCTDDPNEIARTLSQDTRSEVVQVIGKKIILYKQADEPAKRKLKLPDGKA